MTKAEAIALLRSRDHQLDGACREIRRLKKSVMSKPEAAVVRAIMANYDVVLRTAYAGDQRAYLASVSNCGRWRRVIRACARLQKARARKGARHG